MDLTSYLSPHFLPTSLADFPSLPQTGPACSCSGPLHSPCPLAGAPFPSCCPSLGSLGDHSPGRSLVLPLSSHSPPSFPPPHPPHLCPGLPHLSSDTVPCAFASELTPLASTSYFPTMNTLGCHCHGWVCLSRRTGISLRTGSPALPTSGPSRRPLWATYLHT